MVGVIDGVGLGSFDVDVCVVKLGVITKKLGQGVIYPKQLVVPTRTGCDSEGRLEMANGLLLLSLLSTYYAKKSMKLTDQLFTSFLRGEIDCAGCGALCCV